MIFKYTFVAIVLLSCGGVYTATDDTTTSQLIAQLLQSFSKQDSGPKPWHLSGEAVESAPQPRMKPIAAPPPAPALGSVEEPVAWPYPPAPNTIGNSEFPLLERFLKSNGIQSNFQTNQINSHQWSERPVPELKPVTSAPPSNQWGIQSAPQSVPTPAPYIQWGVPQNVQPVPPSASTVPPPLNPNENFYIQHTGQPQEKGQQRHFSLETLRVKEPETTTRDKLNVSFIMPPDIRPLSLNFDTGEVQIDFGDKEGRRVPIPAEALPNKQYRSQLSLDQIFGTQLPKNAPSQSANIQALTQKEEDDEYIVVRHDMNKYAYDLPKGLSIGSTAQSLGSATSQPQQPTVQNLGSAGSPTQTQQVEKYDVSGQKRLHFTLGRVSG